MKFFFILIVLLFLPKEVLAQELQGICSDPALFCASPLILERSGKVVITITPLEGIEAAACSTSGLAHWSSSSLQNVLVQNKSKKSGRTEVFSFAIDQSSHLTLTCGSKISYVDIVVKEGKAGAQKGVVEIVPIGGEKDTTTTSTSTTGDDLKFTVKAPTLGKNITIDLGQEIEFVWDAQKYISCLAKTSQNTAHIDWHGHRALSSSQEDVSKRMVLPFSTADYSIECKKIIGKKSNGEKSKKIVTTSQNVRVQVEPRTLTGPLMKLSDENKDTYGKHLYWGIYRDPLFQDFSCTIASSDDEVLGVSSPQGVSVQSLTSGDDPWNSFTAIHPLKTESRYILRCLWKKEGETPQFSQQKTIIVAGGPEYSSLYGFHIDLKADKTKILKNEELVTVTYGGFSPQKNTQCTLTSSTVDQFQGKKTVETKFTLTKGKTTSAVKIFAFQTPQLDVLLSCGKEKKNITVKRALTLDASKKVMVVGEGRDDGSDIDILFTVRGMQKTSCKLINTNDAGKRDVIKTISIPPTLPLLPGMPSPPPMPTDPDGLYTYHETFNGVVSKNFENFLKVECDDVSGLGTVSSNVLPIYRMMNFFANKTSVEVSTPVQLGWNAITVEDDKKKIQAKSCELRSDEDLSAGFGGNMLVPLQGRYTVYPPRKKTTYRLMCFFDIVDKKKNKTTKDILKKIELAINGYSPAPALDIVEQSTEKQPGENQFFTVLAKGVSEAKLEGSSDYCTQESAFLLGPSPLGIDFYSRYIIQAVTPPVDVSCQIVFRSPISNWIRQNYILKTDFPSAPAVSNLMYGQSGEQPMGKQQIVSFDVNTYAVKESGESAIQLLIGGDDECRQPASVSVNAISDKPAYEKHVTLGYRLSRSIACKVSVRSFYTAQPLDSPEISYGFAVVHIEQLPNEIIKQAFLVGVEQTVAISQIQTDSVGALLQTDSLVGNTGAGIITDNGSGMIDGSILVANTGAAITTNNSIITISNSTQPGGNALLPSGSETLPGGNALVGTTVARRSMSEKKAGGKKKKREYTKVPKISKMSINQNKVFAGAKIILTLANTSSIKQLEVVLIGKDNYNKKLSAPSRYVQETKTFTAQFQLPTSLIPGVYTIVKREEKKDDLFVKLTIESPVCPQGVSYQAAIGRCL